MALRDHHVHEQHLMVRLDPRFVLKWGARFTCPDVVGHIGINEVQALSSSLVVVTVFSQVIDWVGKDVSVQITRYYDVRILLFQFDLVKQFME